MQRERVSENVYWFQSDVYAQVTAGAIIGPQWAVLIDTLALPEETQAMRKFIEENLSVPVRYVINTHYHADHAWGNYCFPEATVVSSLRCRELLQARGPAALEAAKRNKDSGLFRQVKLVPPHLTFDTGTLILRVGKKNLILMMLPGHSPDGIGVLVEEDRVLFAGDAFLPIPHIVDGDIDELSATVKKIGKLGLENIVQGHGDIVLRGEIDEAVKDNLAYLSAVRKAVRSAAKKRNPLEALELIDVESCGKSRVALGGLAQGLHRQNVRALYKLAQAESSEESTNPEPL